MRCGRRLGITEDVVNQRHEGAESLCRSLEHMFVRLRLGSDGHGPTDPFASGLAAALQSPGRNRAPGPQEPSEDQTSSLVRMRSKTAEVNSVLPACPPRSGVLVPEAIVSSVPS